MAVDDVIANAGAGGATFRAFNDGTRDWPANVVSYVTGGSAGAWALQQVDATHGLPCSVLGTVPVSGTFWQATQPVSAASLPLPTGAATAAKQPAIGTAGAASADVLTVQGIASMTALKVDGSAVTQPVSGTVTANAGTGTFTVSGTVTANAGTGSFTVAQATASNLQAQVQGAAASGAAKSGNPVQIGHVFNSTQPTVTTGQAVEAQATARGALIVATGVDVFHVTLNNSTVAVTQSGTWNVTVNTALPAGSNTIGGVKLIDSGGTNVASVSAAGAVKVDGSAVTQPVSGTVTANAGTGSFTVAQATAANLNATVTGTVTANLGTLNGAALDATLTGGSQKAIPVAGTSGGATPTHVLSAGAANQDSTVVKASAGQVYSVTAFNTNAAARYLKLYDKATGPTSADTPVQTFLIPGNASGAGLTLALPVGMNFANGISLRITTGMSDGDTGAAATGDVATSLTYR